MSGMLDGLRRSPRWKQDRPGAFAGRPGGVDTGLYKSLQN
jgi:hypothetical protein